VFYMVRRQRTLWLVLSMGLLTVAFTFSTFAMSTSGATAALAPQVPGAVELELERFSVDTFAQPVKIASTGAAGDTRLFVIERAGVIRILQADGTRLSTPFLTITDRVFSNGSEQGLLGMTFEPADPTIFYVNYTRKDDNPNRRGDTVIARYRVQSGNNNVADPASEQIILVVDQPYANHNAGDLAFGPDGELYIPLGDGGSGGDPDENGQDLRELLGKTLRLRVTGEVTYTIPPDNPYANSTNPNLRKEIWASGFRNPWRFSFDRQTGDIYWGDVGQGAREEISFQPADSDGGENYGWDCFEGNLDHELAGCTERSNYVFPIFDYARDLGNSVTGGFVYRGTSYPNLVGHYIFADFATGRFWSAIRNNQGRWVVTDHDRLEVNGRTLAPSTFGENVNGELFVADYSGGGIYRVQDASSPAETPITTATNIGTATPTVSPSTTVPPSATPTLITLTPPPNQTPRAYLPQIKRSGTN